MDVESTYKNNKNRFSGLLYCSVYSIFLIILISGGTQKEFWYDEVAMLGFVCDDTTLHDLFKIYLTNESTNLPLYAFLLWFVYRLMPAKEMYVLLLSMMLTIGGVIFLGLFAKKRYGKFASLLVPVLSICSTTVRNRIGLELRAYSLLFFAVSFSLYMLLLYSEKASNKRTIILSISLLILNFSHYYGVIVFCLLGVGWGVIVISRKKRIKSFIPFFIAGGAFVFWFILILKNTNLTINGFWIQRPTYKDIPETFGYLLGGTVFGLFIYILSWFSSAIELIKRKKISASECFILFSPILVICTIFAYSKYISKGGGLYEDRYFIAVLPILLLQIVGYAQKCWDRISKKDYLYILPILLLGIMLIKGLERAHWDMVCQIRDASDSANYIKEMGDGNDTDVRIVAISYDVIGRYFTYGWSDFYIKRQLGIENEVQILMKAGLDSLFEEYANSDIDKIYVMADEDFADYYGDDYTRHKIEGVSRLLVFERKENEYN